MSAVIKNLEQVISTFLSPGKKFVSYETKNLLPTGENYGSVMLQLEIKITNENGGEELLSVVGKTCPPSEFLWKVFNTKVTFKKEIALYNTIVPALNEFGKEKGFECLLDFFAKSLGARISLDPNSDDVDSDAVLLLENLKVQGFDVADRFNGFDEETARFLLRDLAVMHAAAIAFRKQKPEMYARKIRPYLNKDFTFRVSEDVLKVLTEQMKEAVMDNPDCVPHVSKIEEAMLKMSDFIDDPPKGNDIFVTLTHNDYWVNNTMVKYENGKPIANKIVDFQIIEESSLANDVVFFLYTSVDLKILEKRVDELIRYYYEKFIETLVKLGCDTEAYSFEEMWREFAIFARDVQFTHVLFILKPIMTLKGKAKELSEMVEKDILESQDALHENYCKRMEFVLLDFVKKMWI